MKPFLFILVLYASLSCVSSNEKKASEKSETKDTVPASADEKTNSPVKVEQTTAFNAVLDSLPSITKESALKQFLVDGVDTYCPVCSQRCCRPCFSGGTAPNCAYLKFKDCSVCNHSSSLHYPVTHE